MQSNHLLHLGKSINLVFEMIFGRLRDKFICLLTTFERIIYIRDIIDHIQELRNK